MPASDPSGIPGALTATVPISEPAGHSMVSAVPSLICALVQPSRPCAAAGLSVIPSGSETSAVCRSGGEPTLRRFGDRLGNVEVDRRAVGLVGAAGFRSQARARGRERERVAASGDDRSPIFQTRFVGVFEEGAFGSIGVDVQVGGRGLGAVALRARHRDEGAGGIRPYACVPAARPRRSASTRSVRAAWGCCGSRRARGSHRSATPLLSAGFGFVRAS